MDGTGQKYGRAVERETSTTGAGGEREQMTLFVEEERVVEK